MGLTSNLRALAFLVVAIVCAGQAHAQKKLSAYAGPVFSEKGKQSRAGRDDKRLAITILRRDPTARQSLRITGLQDRHENGTFKPGLTWTTTEHYDETTRVTASTTERGTRFRFNTLEFELDHLQLNTQRLSPLNLEISVQLGTPTIHVPGE